MASNIKFKRSAVQNRVPTTAQLDLGELALNTYDGKLYTEINTGSAAVVEIGSKLSSLVVDGANGAGGGDVVFHGTTAGRDLTWDYSVNRLNFADNADLTFGTSNDLIIVHNGNHSLIQDAGQGNLSILSDSLYLQNSSGSEVYLRALDNTGALDLYFNNSIRLSTTGDGVDIGGTGSLKIPVGTTAQRSGSPTNGDLRYNTTTGGFEGYSSGGWGELGGGGVGIGSTSINPQSGLVGGRIGVGFTDINIVGSGVSVTGYGTTIVIDFNDFKPGSFHRSIHNYTATAGQTTFAGLNYVASEKQIAVYLNGARLSEATYTATSGTTVVLDVGASLDDEVEIINIHTNSDVDRKVNTYTATAGQTTFTGLSYNSKTELDVYLNGIRLASDDFTATSGTTVVLAVGASVNDVVDIVSTGDGVSFRSTADTSGDKFTLTNVGIGTDITPDKLNVRGNVNVVGVSTFNGNVDLLDNNKLRLGTSADLQIYHTGSHAYMHNVGTGMLLIQGNNTNSIRIRPKSDEESIKCNPNGAVELYHDNAKKFETTSSGCKLTDSNTNAGLQFTTSTGNNGYVWADNADVIGFRDANPHWLVKCIKDGAVELYHDNVKKFETTSTGATITGRLTIDGLDLGDSETIRLGASQDLQLFHNGSHSYISDLGTGDLRITGSAVHIQNAAQSENMIKCFEGDRVELYHNNSKKFETLNTGAKVTGNLEVTGVVTYDDVTSVDSVGIITARQGVRVTADGSSSSNYISVGAGSDLKLYHDGTNSYIKSSTGELRFNSDSYTFNNAANNANAFTIDAGGSTNFYHNGTRKAYTASTGFVFEDEIRLADNIKAEFGSSQDLKLYHSGSHAILNNITGSFQVHDAGTEKFRVSGTGTFFKDDITLSNDNDKLNIGAGNDLQLYHDGTANNNVISGHLNSLNIRNYDTNSTNINLSARNDILLQTAINESAIWCDANAGVHLYYDGSQKFQTASHGATLSGNLNINGAVNANIRMQSGPNTVYASVDFYNNAGSAANSINSYAASILFITGRDATVFSDSSAEICEIVSSGIHPRTASTACALGTSSKRWDNVYADAANIAGLVTVDTSGNEKIKLSGSTNPLIRWQESSTNKAYIQWNSGSGFLGLYNQEDSSSLRVKDTIDFSTDGSTYHTVWHAGNDGSGSGLDADTLDGVQATGFVSTGGNSSNAMTGNLRLDISSTVDGELGQAFSGYFGLKHRDQTYGSEYMILSQDAHTFISASSGSHVYIRGGGNSSTNQMIVSTSGTTIGGNTVWHAGNDGTGSGLDADTLDGVEGSAFLRSNANDTMSGTLTYTTGNAAGWVIENGKASLWSTGSGTGANPTVNHDARSDGGTGARLHKWNSPNHTGGSYQPYQEAWYDGDSYHYLKVQSNVFKYDNNTVWHAGNDGSGSGLDADTLDGVQGSSYVRSDADDTINATLTTRRVSVQANHDIRFANGNWTGDNAGKIQHHNNTLYVQGGSGANNNKAIIFRSPTTDRFYVGADGHFYPNVDSTYDIGSSSIRVRNGYFDTLYGDGSNLTGITAITINTNTSGNLLAASGSANSINGQSGLRAHGNAYFHSNNDNGGISFGTAGAGSFGTTPTIARAGQNNYHMSGSGQGDLCIGAEFQDDIRFGTSTGTSGALTTRLIIQAGGDILPGSNSSQDLGNSSTRWNNIYSADLQLSNESKKDTGGNDVDGTWGDWTLQEGESDVFMINNRSGKKFRIKMEEVS